MPRDDIQVLFGDNARATDVTDYSMNVLKDILENAGLKKALISSTARSPADQARVMYDNLLKFGVQHQKNLYAAAGDQVIDVFATGSAAKKSPDQIKQEMARKIMELGPARVSKHAADPRVLNVFDVAPSSISDKDAFEASVEHDRRVSKFLVPPDDPGYHLEIPQTGAEHEPVIEPARGGGERCIVRPGSRLNLRTGPSLDAAVIRTCASGTPVTVISRSGVWAAVDLSSDGLIDGFMNAEHLVPQASPARPADANTPPAIKTAAVHGGVLDKIDAALVQAMFPATRRSNIEKNLPFVLAGLRACELTDRSMALMALATIRAETEGFVPISEGQSRFNTAGSPFDLYDAGTNKGRNLGNVRPGDGPLFKGRGFVQLTGRSNYERIGKQIQKDLLTDPEQANDPTCAGLILARFLKNKEQAIRAALDAGSILKARQLVNGGSHGLDRFQDAYNRGADLLA